MRKATLIIFSVLLCGYVTAQFKPRLPVPSFSDSLSMVINDAGHNYYTIQGVALTSETDRDSYQSKVTLPGSSLCMIYRYHSTQDTSASWHAIMYKGEDYKEAVKSYKNTFRLVKKTKFMLNSKSIHFEGAMDEPDESLRFTVSTLRTSSQVIGYDNFIAEVEMVNSYDGWEVHLNIQKRKNDTERY